MKKIITKLIAVLFVALIITGCGKAHFEFSGGFGKYTFKVNDVDNDAYGESFAIGINDGKKFVIDSALTKGQLKIDFAEVVNFATGDEPDDYEVVGIVDTITIGPGEKKEVSVPGAEYFLQLTAIGNTDGELTVTIE